MATAAHPEIAGPVFPSRDEILEWYENLARRAHHQILGVTRGADRNELRTAFISLARRFHPDALSRDHGDLRREIQAIFSRITEAYQALVAAGPASREPAPRPTPAKPIVERQERPVAPRDSRAEAAVPGRVTPIPSTHVHTIRSEQESETPSQRRERVEEALLQAETESAGGDTETAVNHLHQVLFLADDRQRRRIRLALARAYLADTRWHHNGVRLLEDVLRDEPGAADALALLGAIFLRQGLLVRAEVLLARAVVADPANARARSDLREVREALRRRRAPVPSKDPGRSLVARLLSIAR